MSNNQMDNENKVHIHNGIPHGHKKYEICRKMSGTGKYYTE